MNLFTRTDTRAEVLEGDCLDRLREMEDESVEAVVTDPPAGISFMNAEWDSNKGSRNQWIAWLTEVMEEVLRVTKPGGHALVWALPRTSHWTAMALEDAGWEVRDRVTHVQGAGFPKSLNVEKALRKLGEDEAADTFAGYGSGLKPSVEDWWLCRKPLEEKSIARNVLKHGTGALNIDDSRVKSEPFAGIIDTCRANQNPSSANGAESPANPDSTHLNGSAIRNAAGSQGAAESTTHTDGKTAQDTSASNTGWTISGSTSTNSSTGGCGEKQDEKYLTDTCCTTSTKSEQTTGSKTSSSCCGETTGDSTTENPTNTPTAEAQQSTPADGKNGTPNTKPSTQQGSGSAGGSNGRWPSHLLLSHVPGPNGCVRVGEKRVKGNARIDKGNKKQGRKTQVPPAKPGTTWGDPDGKETVAAYECAEGCPCKAMDEMSGDRPGSHKQTPTHSSNAAFGGGRYDNSSCYSDSGGASRFFAQFHEPDTGAGFLYQSKASRKDRSSNGTVENTHPTCKSTPLLRYLIRLITPPGGTVLDCFLGSGSTGVAAVHEGFDFVGIEAEPEYAEIARRRIAHALENPEV